MELIDKLWNNWMINWIIEWIMELIELIIELLNYQLIPQ